MMDNTAWVILLISCAISFGLGKTIVYFRDKKRQAAKDKAPAEAARVKREKPPEPPSKNKSKRKRQLQGKDGF